MTGKLLANLTLVAFLAPTLVAQCPTTPASLLGPTPYLCIHDSPFVSGLGSGSFVVEDFEDGVLDVPGVTATGVGLCITPVACFSPTVTDSVDCDDGVIDGSGQGGTSLWAQGPQGITFTFDAMTLGGLPTMAGVVWTDGGGTTTFRAFDAMGASLGVIGPVMIADGSTTGTTAEDRFFGVVCGGGISAIHISNTIGGIEVDHLQFGVSGAAAPVFGLAVSPSQTVLSVSANNLSALDLNTFSFRVNGLEAWPLLLSLLGTPGVTSSLTSPTSAEIVVAFDLTTVTMLWSGCDIWNQCGLAIY